MGFRIKAAIDPELLRRAEMSGISATYVLEGIRAVAACFVLTGTFWAQQRCTQSRPRYRPTPPPVGYTTDGPRPRFRVPIALTDALNFHLRHHLCNGDLSSIRERCLTFLVLTTIRSGPMWCATGPLSEQRPLELDVYRDVSRPRARRQSVERCSVRKSMMLRRACRDPEQPFRECIRSAR